MTSRDVALREVRMPVMDGNASTERLSRNGPRVLMLTAFDLDEAIRAGASGFLLRDVPLAELAHAVRVVAAGETLLARAITRRLVEDRGLAVSLTLAIAGWLLRRPLVAVPAALVEA